ncbi:glycine, alanine and asparagine-rich protein-like [Triticum dicoccoides]|uniref:glycine, alanine and asparagine-rich protein-like n=1 Tax=Triticum dicoccoides TaxID=85692 RepID=UPI000E794EA7|nr:glycine, alanine and asparagine-rich protein-like [Triticum dicoccoides]
MEISAATATAGSSPPAKPVLLRPHATSSATTTISRRASASASTTVRRRRARTRRSKTISGAGGDDGEGPFGPGSGGSGGGGGGGWNHGFGSGSGQGWDSSEPDVPTPRRSAAEVALGVIYELMCLIALSNCTQFAVRRLAGLLAARVAALRFVPRVC